MDKKTLRTLTFLNFGLLVVIGIVATITTGVISRMGNSEVLKISSMIFMWLRDIMSLVLIVTLIVNIVMLRNLPESGKERRFSIMSLISFIIFLVFKIGLGFSIQFLIRVGGINGLSLPQVVGIAQVIGLILGSIIFILSAILYIVGGVLSSNE